MTRWRTRHRGDHGERGAAAVEFAIVFVLLIFILLSLIDFGRLFFAYQGIKSASREGARAAAVNAVWGAAPTTIDGVPNASLTSSSPTPTPGSIVARVKDSGMGAASLGGATALRVSSSAALSSSTNKPCAVAGEGNSVTILVHASFSWFTPALPLLGIVVGPLNIDHVDASTTMRCEPL